MSKLALIIVTIFLGQAAYAGGSVVTYCESQAQEALVSALNGAEGIEAAIAQKTGSHHSLHHTGSSDALSDNYSVEVYTFLRIDKTGVYRVEMFEVGEKCSIKGITNTRYPGEE